MKELSILEISQCIFCMEIWPFLIFHASLKLCEFTLGNRALLIGSTLSIER